MKAIKKNKRILLLGINFYPEVTGIGKYTGELVQWLGENDFDCTVVTGFPYYPHWKIQKPYRGNFYKKDIGQVGNTEIYRCPMYVPATPSGLKRVVQEISFFISAFFIITMLLFRPKHDTIFCIVPPFHLGFLALYYRFFKSGKIIYHVQDLQIEAARDLKILRPGWIFSILFQLEKLILKRVDFVSSISSGMVKKIEKKANKKVLFFPNWADTEGLFPLNAASLGKTKWGFNQYDKIILYSGSVGEKQGLDCLVRIAKDVLAFDEIKFVICGSGPYKEKLKAMAEKYELKNFYFFSLQPQAVFNEFLNMADVHLVIQKKEASDLVLPSKLTNILSVGGLAIVSASGGTTLYETIKEHDMGLVIAPGNEKELKEAILTCCTKDFTLQKKNARIYANNNLVKNKILEQMLLQTHICE